MVGFIKGEKCAQTVTLLFLSMKMNKLGQRDSHLLVSSLHTVWKKEAHVYVCSSNLFIQKSVCRQGPVEICQRTAPKSACFDTA